MAGVSKKIGVREKVGKGKKGVMTQLKGERFIWSDRHSGSGMRGSCTSARGN